MILLTIVFDKSGSMSTHRDTYITAMNDLLKEQPVSTVVNCLQFSDRVEWMEDTYLPVKEFPKFDLDNYHPEGMTALYDAIAEAIVGTRKAMTGMGVLQPVLFIQTDGRENRSQIKLPEVRHLIEQAVSEGWQFHFLSADLDTANTTERLGLPRACATIYDCASEQGCSDGIRSVSRHISHTES